MHMITVRESNKKGKDYSCFIADESKNIMLEIFHNNNAPVIGTVDIGALHFASMTKNIKAAKVNLIKSGARLLGDIIVTADGDSILGLSDPWGFPLQFVTRTKPMLK